MGTSETSFAKSASLKEYEEFDGHAAIKKGAPCFLCRKVRTAPGMTSTVLPKNIDVNQVLQLQKIKDNAIRRRQKMLLTGRARTNEMEDEFHSMKKTNDGSIRLVCFRCWNEFENTKKS
eukprot:536498-Amphidinium_carterae.1